MRTRIFESPLAVVDDLRVTSGDRSGPLAGHSPDFQICLPYEGVFVWHVGGDAVVGEANQVLFVSGGEDFRVSRPGAQGYGELIVTPQLPLLSGLARTGETRLSAHPLFVRRSRRADARLQQLRARFVHLASQDNHDPVAVEELLTELLRCALDGHSRRAPAASTRRLIRRTKLFLEANSGRRVSLAEVGRAVGSSPAYLTDVFRRAEGVPIHRYLVQLRLARALVELPHANDLTALALGLGFSSHSHFAAAFRRAFTCTPSAFRALTRRQRTEKF